ncbi:MAG: hypothetical protein QOJ56_4340 [Mycobacterium sp.]|nr:hypothetical protein [Mycobacterium sp.]
MRFTVRGPARAEVSPCCHRPSGGDVACGVHVSIARPRSAGDALEIRLALAVFRRDMPAVGASLRRVRCWNEFDPPQGLVRQPCNQQSPSLAANLTVEAPFLRDVGAWAFTRTTRRPGHSTHIQILDADGVEPTRQIGGGLFHPVTAAICFAGAQPRNGQLRSCAPMRSAARPGQTLLQSAQPLSFTSTKARNAQQVPGGQRNRHRHAAINTNNAPIIGSRHRLSDGSKSDVPTPRPIQIDSVGLHRVGDVAGPPEPHPTDLRYPYLPIAAAQPPNVAQLKTDLPESFIRAGLTPRRATVGAVKKVAHRLREVPQRLLLYGLRPGCQPVAFGAGRRQLRTLLVVTGRSAARLPVLLLLHSQIPHKPGMATVLGHCSRLLRAGKQAEPAHINNVGITTDNLSKGGTWRFLPRPKPRVSTPQI